MTTTSASTPTTRSPAATFTAAVRAEAHKLGTLPAIWLLLVGTIALTVGLSLLFAANSGGAELAGLELDIAVTAIPWTQCGFFLLGVVAATSEYIGGQIRTTLVAMPNRVMQRVAALAALTILALIAGLITVSCSIVTMFIAANIDRATIDPSTLIRVVVNASVYLTLMSALSSALGFLIRKAIPTAAILLVYLLIVSPLLQGQSWYWLPDMASYTLWFPTTPADAPDAPIAWLTIIAWTLAFLVPSIIIGKRRDT